MSSRANLGWIGAEMLSLRHIVFAALAVTLPLMVSWEVLAQAGAATRVLVGINIALPLLGIVRSCANGLHPVSLIFFLFSLCWLGVAPLVQLSLGQAAWGDWQTLTDTVNVDRALMLGVVMQAMVLLGSSVTLTSRSPKPWNTPSFNCHEWLLRGMALALLMLGPIAVRLQGGIGVFFSSRDSRDDVLSASGLDSSTGGGASAGFAVLLPIALALTLTHLTLHELREETSSVRRRELLVLLVLGIAGLAVFANPISSTRFAAAVAFGSVILAALRPRRRGIADVVALVGLATVLWIYPLMGQNGSGPSQNSQVTQLSSALTGADFDGFQQVVNSVKYVDSYDISNGQHFLSSALFFVPRGIWQGKAEPATFEVSHDAGYWFTNLSMPLHAELYLDFGVIGVILGCLALGLVAGWLDSSWVSCPYSRSATLAPVVALAMLAVLRGPSGSLVSVYLPTIVLMLVAMANLPNRILHRIALCVRT